ncbi:MAG: hypothetical protein C6H99_02260 [Epsilonproteobacteria bacterium]|nr:hypothetical protein [Campylobacterota bacterium]
MRAIKHIFGLVVFVVGVAMAQVPTIDPNIDIIDIPYPSQDEYEYVGGYDTIEPITFALADQKVFLADRRDGVYVLDVANPASIQKIKLIQSTLMRNIKKLEVTPYTTEDAQKVYTIFGGFEYVEKEDGLDNFYAGVEILQGIERKNIFEIMEINKVFNSLSRGFTVKFGDFDLMEVTYFPNGDLRLAELYLGLNIFHGNWKLFSELYKGLVYKRADNSYYAEQKNIYLFLTDKNISIIDVECIKNDVFEDDIFVVLQIDRTGGLFVVGEDGNRKFFMPFEGIQGMVAQKHNESIGSSLADLFLVRARLFVLTSKDIFIYNFGYDRPTQKNLLKLVARIRLSHPAKSFSIDGDRLYAVEGEEGVEVFDISDVAHPFLRGYIGTYATLAQGSEELVYILNPDTGLKIYKRVGESSSSSSSTSSSSSSSTSSSNSSSSSTSSSASSSSTSSSEQSSTSSSSSSAQDQVGGDGILGPAFLSELLGEEFKVNGYFYHFGNGAFDWIYISSSKAFVAKLEGMDEQGYFRWTNLRSLVGDVDLYYEPAARAGIIELKNVSYEAPAYLKALDGKVLEADGYFFNYGNGAFDWLYLSSSGRLLAKLEGMDDRGYFVWTQIEDLVDFEFDGERLRIDPKE